MVRFAGCQASEGERAVEFDLGRLTGHIHLRVQDLQASRRFYLAVLAVPAFDPDLNNIETVYHGRAVRSAPSIVVTPEA
jgi:hypothetical protein